MIWNEPARDPLGQVPAGVVFKRLTTHDDDRGSLTEIYRENWVAEACRPVQWNVVHSRPGVLRGFHVHAAHHDYLLVVRGRLYLGLQDMRPSAPTYGLACLVCLEAGPGQAAAIPPGVAHGFYFDRESTHLYGVSHYWDPRDELACRWDDPGVRVPWPIRWAPLLSEKDAAAGSFADMAARLAERRPADAECR